MNAVTDKPLAHPEAAGTPTVYAFFMLVRTTTTWLKLTPEERFAFLREQIFPVLQQFPDVSMRFFDAEAFSGRVSDVILWETTRIYQYQALVEKLRETLFWGTYFDVIDIVPAIENAYRQFYPSFLPQ
jgi:hypothetical protein